MIKGRKKATCKEVQRSSEHSVNLGAARLLLVAVWPGCCHQRQLQPEALVETIQGSH